MLTISGLVLSILSGILYRLGGIGAPFNTKIRDLGVPTVATAYLLIGNGFHWTLCLCFLALFGSLTTYWKKKGSDAMWYNWLFTGLGYSLAALPLVIQMGLWVGFGIRTVILTAFITLWSVFVGQDWLEEGGRGFAITATLPLLFI